MKEFQLLRQGLYHNCPELHGKRLETLMVAIEALYHSDTLALTALGRHIDNGCRTKSNIKKMDRFLNNSHLQQERIAVYRWQAELLCRGTKMPEVLVDWADIREKERIMVLKE